MRTMQLNTRESRISHESRSINKLRNNPLDLRTGHLPRCRPGQSRNKALQQTTTQVNRNGTRRNSARPDTAVACNPERLATWVANLHDGRCAVLLACIGVVFPLRDQVFLALVFGVQGRVEGTS